MQIVYQNEQQLHALAASIGSFKFKTIYYHGYMWNINHVETVKCAKITYYSNHSSQQSLSLIKCNLLINLSPEVHIYHLQVRALRYFYLYNHIIFNGTKEADISHAVDSYINLHTTIMLRTGRMLFFSVCYCTERFIREKYIDSWRLQHLK